MFDLAVCARLLTLDTIEIEMTLIHLAKAFAKYRGVRYTHSRRILLQEASELLGPGAHTLDRLKALLPPNRCPSGDRPSRRKAERKSTTNRK